MGYYTGKLMGVLAGGLQDVRRSIVADYPLNEGGGTTINEVVNGMNGTIVNSISWSNNIATFSGTSLIIVPHDARLNITGERTYSLWVKYIGGENTVIVDKNANNGLSIQTISGVLIHSPLFLPAITTGSINNNIFHHVVFSLNVNNLVIKVYVDGIYITQYSCPSTPNYGTNTPLYIGSRNGLYGYTGSAGDIRMYNTILTDAEITQLYNYQKTRYGL